MSHITENKKKLSARISRIKGQVEAIEKSLNVGVECTHFLHQIASVRGAIDGLMSEALEGHIREHLGNRQLSHHGHEHDESNHHDSKQDDLEEVINVLKTYLK